jgi:hypothetical protein
MYYTQTGLVGGKPVYHIIAFSENVKYSLYEDIFNPDVYLHCLKINSIYRAETIFPPFDGACGGRELKVATGHKYVLDKTVVSTTEGEPRRYTVYHSAHTISGCLVYALALYFMDQLKL